MLVSFLSSREVQSADDPRKGAKAQNTAPIEPSPDRVRRWRRYLANERAEAYTYYFLASKHTGEEREILTALADAEQRHEDHWLGLLGPHAKKLVPPDFATRLSCFCARRFGSVFSLALMQRTESRNPYQKDADAAPIMAQDELVHAEVVRLLAQKARIRLSGNFRAAVFGATDGLISNLALVLGMAGSGVAVSQVFLAGIAGMLAGALSMAAGEYMSVSSARDILRASSADKSFLHLADVDLEHEPNELALLARASEQSAPISDIGEMESATNPVSAALLSFAFFASGAILPVIPWIFAFFFGQNTSHTVLIAVLFVAVALFCVGFASGIVSNVSAIKVAVKQLVVGLCVAALSWGLGTLMGGLLL